MLNEILIRRLFMMVFMMLKFHIKIVIQVFRLWYIMMK